jgi:HK97 family phage major capsid protein
VGKRRKAVDVAAEMEILRSELATLDEVGEPTEEQVSRATAALGEFETLATEHAAAVNYEARIEAVRSADLAAVEPTTPRPRSGPEVMRRVDPFAILETRGHGMGGRELLRALVDSNLKAVEGRDIIGDNQAHFETIIKRHARSRDWALNVLARSRDEYETGFAKMMIGRPELLTEVERAALAVATNVQGGYLVPTHLDPTLILTNSGSSNVIRSLARVVTLASGEKQWNGVTSAGVTASWDGELVEVSDDSPTVGTAGVPTIMAQALVQASISAFEGISGLGSDVMMLFADARDRLEGTAHATGAGTTTPKGIFTALAASSGVCITSTTAATIGEVDIHALYRGVPVRWRGNGTFLASPLYLTAVKRLGTAVSSAFSGDLTQPVTDRILGRPVVESDDAPTTQTTTALDSEIVFGDFSNYLVVDRPGGMSVDFIPHLFNTSNNLPDGRRAWYAYWHNGADAINLSAFRLLVDKTSA